jgi:predicted outer membrane repeat protein
LEWFVCESLYQSIAGGAIFMDRGRALLINVTFQANSADLAGGALYAWNANKATNVTIVGGSFVGNEARTQWGGAVANWHSTVLLNGSVLDGNQAAMMGGALWTDAESTSNLTHATWTVNNTAAAAAKGGGGGGVVWSHPKGDTYLLSHNTFLVDHAAQATPSAVGREFMNVHGVQGGGLDVRIL